MTLVSVKECESKQYYHPRAGNVWLRRGSVARGTSDNELRENPFYATLRDSQRHTYTPTFGGCRPALESMRMEKGDKTHGFITFEVPRSATGIRLDVRLRSSLAGRSRPLEFLVVR